MGWKEEGTTVFGVSGKEPGKVVLGCPRVTAVRVRETVSVAVWRRVDTMKWAYGDMATFV